MAFELKFHHGGVSVPDLEASVIWYREVLGFEEEFRFHLQPANAQIAMLKRGPLRIELFQVNGAQPLPPARRIPDQDLRTHGNKHVCFGIQSVDAAEQELRAKNVDIVFIKRTADLPPNIFIRDNAGNLIEFIQQPDLW